MKKTVCVTALLSHRYDVRSRVAIKECLLSSELFSIFSKLAPKRPLRKIPKVPLVLTKIRLRLVTHCFAGIFSLRMSRMAASMPEF